MQFWTLILRSCGWRFTAQLRPMAGKTTLVWIEYRQGGMVVKLRLRSIFVTVRASSGVNGGAQTRSIDYPD
jgi:hypothetical protein